MRNLLIRVTVAAALALVVPPTARAAEAMKVGWVGKSSASNTHFYETSVAIPSGAIVKVKVIKTDSPFLNVDGEVFKKSEPGQILEQPVKTAGPVRIRIGNQQADEKVVRIEAGKNNTWTLVFERSEFQVKILPNPKDDF